MDDKELIAQQAHTIKLLRAEADIYRDRAENVRAEVSYITEYLKTFLKNLNKHMSNPKLYPRNRGNRKQSEH